MDEATVSIEEHARLHRRYHPVIIRQVLRLHQGCPGFARLFRTPRDVALFVASIARATVVISRKQALASGRRAPGKRRNACVKYHRHFPRQFAGIFHDDRGAARAFLRASVALAKARAATRAGARAAPSTTTKVSATPCYMIASKATWAAGVLNKPGRHTGNTFDLTTVEGFVYLMHEIYHTMQWFRSPLKLLIGYVDGVAQSLARSDGHIPWAHELIGFEVEAIAFHERLWLLLDAWEGAPAFLQAFKTHQ